MKDKEEIINLFREVSEIPESTKGREAYYDKLIQNFLASELEKAQLNVEEIQKNRNVKIQTIYISLRRIAKNYNVKVLKRNDKIYLVKQ